MQKLELQNQIKNFGKYKKISNMINKNEGQSEFSQQCYQKHEY